MSKELIKKVAPALQALEDSKRQGYVPAVEGAENSGVTVAKGLDLGQYSYADLTDNLKLPKELASKLQPYLRHKGTDAKALLAVKPLVITPEEEQLINNNIIDNELRKLKKNFKFAVGRDFEEEPENVQQALLIASFNLGSGLDSSSLFTLPSGKPSNFRNQIKNKQYKEAGNNLKTWSKNMATGLRKRRLTEGELLSGEITPEQFIDQLNVNLKIAEQYGQPDNIEKALIEMVEKNNNGA